MSYRQILIQKKCHLSIENSNIKIKRDDIVNSIPSEDVAIIVVDCIDITFSAPFFNECSKEGIVVLICGNKHYPVMQALPINSHYRLYDILLMQVKQSNYFKETVTEQLLKAKLANQKKVLELIGADADKIEMFNTYIGEITGHDDINREGTAAKVFFNALYEQEYTRFESDPINAVQNYGYAILSSSISRSLSLLGFNLCIGVNHEGHTNPFNLTYDMIEPFRAIVDYYIYEMRNTLTDELNVQTKKELVNLLNIKVKVNGVLYTVQYAIDLLCKSYLRMLEYGKDELDLPEIVKTDFLKENEFI